MLTFSLLVPMLVKVKHLHCSKQTARNRVGVINAVMENTSKALAAPGGRGT